MAWITKNAQTRIDDVRDDIVGLTAAPHRVAMGLWIDNYWNSTYGVMGPALKAASRTMSMAGVANAGTKQDRANRRVLMFLEAMKANSSLPGARAIATAAPAATLAGRIQPLIDKLTIEADQNFGTGALITAKFNDLRLHTRRFLTDHRLNSGSIGVTVRNYFFYEYSKDQYKIDMARPAHCTFAHAFDAVTVPGVFWLNVPGRGNNPANGSFATIAGVELDLAVSNVMISTMFSGCSFCFKRENAGGAIHAAHIMPDDGAGNVVQGAGTGLARQLDGQVATVTRGDFTGTGAGPFHVYGAGYSSLPAPLNVGYPVRTALDEFMNIVGTHRGGDWRIYSQHIRNNVRTVVRLR